MESFLSMLAGWFMGLWTWLVELNGMLQVVLVLLCVVASGVCASSANAWAADDRGIRRTDLEPHAGDGHRVDRGVILMLIAVLAIARPCSRRCSASPP